MFHFTRRRRRRWSLPLIAVMLLHWCLGLGVAMADVLCLEPDGKAVLELNGNPAWMFPPKKRPASCVSIWRWTTVTPRMSPRPPKICNP